jgi:Zn-dependent peptidase ImmA (M78 family)
LREVVTDENGDPILDKDGNKVTQPVERTFPTFKVGYVFAYEDTSGKPLPSIVSILDKDVDNYDAVIEALRKISPAPIRFADFDGNANGYYDLVNREIVVKASLPQAQKVKSAIHEIAHSILHDKIDGLDPEATKREMEVSAESIAFVVCSWLGLKTNEYSFGYVSGWSAGKELKELQQKMEVIRSTASMIISGLDGELMQQQQIVQEEEIEEEQEMLQTVTVVNVQKNKPQRSVSHRRR